MELRDWETALEKLIPMVCFKMDCEGRQKKEYQDFSTFSLPYNLYVTL